jgi:sugar diacid utilization regulator
VHSLHGLGFPEEVEELTVQQLLDEPLLHGCLLAGKGGLTKVVSWLVPLIDSTTQSGGPELGDELRGAAAYVTASVLEGAGGASLVDRLTGCGASAVLVRPNGDGEPDLADACRAAEAADLPLLLLRPQAGFRETSRLVATKVLAQSTHVLQYESRVHRMLGDVFARGGGLPALAHTMARLSGASVLILSTSGELLASTSPASGTDASDALAAEARLHLDELFEVERSDADPEAPLSTVVTLAVDGTKRHAVLARIGVGNDRYGALALVAPTYPLPDHDLSQNIAIAEQGVSLTASELLRQQSVREAEERARNDFVHALLHGRFTDQFELAARAQHYQFPLGAHFVAYVVTAGVLHPDNTAARGKAHDAARLAASVVPDDGRVTLSALIGALIVVIREVESAGSSADEAIDGPESRGFANQLYRAMRSRLGDDVRVSFGRAHEGAPGVARSYREARTAEALGRRVSTGSVSSYARLRVFAAIEDAAKSEAGRAFAAEVLAPLKQTDGQTGNLEEVVLAYIEESGNLNATARRLHLHRNTMLYKLDRASRALQMDLRTTEAQFMVWLAHHITALSDVEQQLDRELAPPR